MAHWALVNPSGHVVMVAEAAALPALDARGSWEQVQGWSGWPPGKPYASAPAVIVNGSVVWGDTRTLRQRKDAKWAEIKAERTRRIGLPQATDAGAFDGGVAGIANINSVVTLLRTVIARGGQSTIRFTLADNTRVQLTLSQLEDAALQMGAAIQGLYETANTLRQQIEAAQDAAAVEAVTWPA